MAKPMILEVIDGPVPLIETTTLNSNVHQTTVASKVLYIVQIQLNQEEKLKCLFFSFY